MTSSGSRRGVDALRRGAGAAGWRASAAVRALPDFLVIGAQKAGTTSLYDHLGAAPSVLPARKKEVRFFDRHWERGVLWYRWSFPTRVAMRRPGRITGEATPDYLLHPLAPERAAAVVPDCRLIVVLRHPVDRAHSQYRMNLVLGTEDRPFAEAVDDELARLAAAGSSTPEALGTATWDHQRNFHSYVERSRYQPQLARWMAHFPSEQIHVTSLERLLGSPAEETGALCELLGIPVGTLPSRLVQSNRRDYDDLRPAERRRLFSLFEDDLERTQEIIGFDLGYSPG